MQEHQRRTKEIERKFTEKEKFLQDNLRKQMQRMIQEQNKEIDEMQSEFQNASHLMQEKYNMLNTKFGDL